MSSVERLNFSGGTHADGAAEENAAIALDALWREFGDQFRRRARTRLRQYGLSGQTESMDICNDVMVDMTRRQRDRELTVDEVLAYVMRAIDNQVLDTFRTLARQCRDFRRNEGTPPEQIQVATDAMSASQIAVRREVLDKIRSQLSQQDRLAVEMMLSNYGWGEIGERLGIQADTARMRVQRAIEKARRSFAVPGEISG